MHAAISGPGEAVWRSDSTAIEHAHIDRLDMLGARGQSLLLFARESKGKEHTYIHVTCTYDHVTCKYDHITTITCGSQNFAVVRQNTHQTVTF